MKKIVIIGSGFSSLSAACYLAKEGHQVVVLEKNESAGGRASRLSKNGFNFDMGPTWYWMPDVFETFFADFGKKPIDYYTLDKLKPAYKVVFGKDDEITISDNPQAIQETFESYEKGAGKKLEKFLDKAGKNYDIAIKDLVYQPGDSILEIVNWETAKRLPEFISNISNLVRKDFKDERLRLVLEFPVLFLGAKASKTPAFYSFMNFADFGLGTFHPKKGMFEVGKAMYDLATELGVKFHFHTNVQKINTQNNVAVSVTTDKGDFEGDIILSGADYHFTEKLLDLNQRNYTEKYWSKKTFAPSSLLFYVGFDKKLKNVEHHTLYFDVPFAPHASDIYDKPKWPEKPLFYASFPSVTDNFFAPEGKEAATFLIPIAPGLEDTPELRETYFEKIITRLEQLTEQELKSSVLFKDAFCVNDFVERYNSYKGNAYGLANTLFQTHILRPKIQNKKVKNIYFTGQLTLPGPGVPPALISGKIVAQKIHKNIKK